MASPADDDDLDALVRRVDPERWLASRFIADRVKRADVVALYAYDHELSRAPRVASTTLIAEIRLTWWREVLDEIYADRPVSAHPTARSLSEAVRRRGLPREPLEAMLDARIEALDRTVISLDQAEVWAGEVGGSATFLASLVLDPRVTPTATRNAGVAWGLSTLRGSGCVFDGLDARLSVILGAAKVESRKLTAATFPAVAAVTLVRDELAGRRPMAFEVRLCLLAAVLRGSI